MSTLTIWRELGASYPKLTEDDAPVWEQSVRAAFDVLAPIQPSGWRHPRYDVDCGPIPTPSEVWKLASEVGSGCSTGGVPMKPNSKTKGQSK